MNPEDFPKVDVRQEADGVTVFTVMPEAEPEDLVAAFAAFMRESPTPLVLWDLRQGRFRRVTGDELRSMVPCCGRWSRTPS